jgi:hypothetical protein
MIKDDSFAKKRKLATAQQGGGQEFPCGCGVPARKVRPAKNSNTAIYGDYC